MAETAFPTQAYNVLIDEVYKPIFLQKLARDWGVQPQNDEEAEALVGMATDLGMADAEETAKQAEAASSLITAAADGLKTAMAKRGIPVQPGSRDRMIQKTAADAVAKFPHLAEAAVAFGSYQGN